MKRLLLPYAVLAAAALAAWQWFRTSLMPALLTRAYSGDGPAILERFMGGRDVTPLERYLDAWTGLANQLTPLLVVAALALGVVIWQYERVSKAVRSAIYGEPKTDWRGVAVLGMCMGLLCGAGEQGPVAIRRAIAFTAEVPNPALLWVAPLTGAVALPVALLLVLVLLRLGGAVSGTVPAFLAVLAAGFSFLRYAELGLHPAAVLILAAGIASRVARPLARHMARGGRRLKVATALGIALCVGWAAFNGARTHIAETRALAALPDATEGAPNILLLILDTVRAKSLGFHGNPRPVTERLDRLSQEGVVFENAIATAPWTLPSHASVFTGLWAHELEADWVTRFETSPPTLSEVLSGEG